MLRVFKKNREKKSKPIPQSLPSETSNEEIPRWYKYALDELGQKEIRGRRHNDRILEYLETTTLSDKWAGRDETPWCAAFIGWTLEKSGIPSIRSARARSYEHWGIELDEPKVGCLAVFYRNSRSSGNGHIGYFVGKNPNGSIRICGGNQSDSVRISNYSTDKLLSYRWPYE